LVPHRDSRRRLRDWSASLFAGGFSGAWSFPWAAPLAVLSRPFSAGELKHCARRLREAARLGGGNSEGAIKTGPASGAAFPGGLGRAFSGPGRAGFDGPEQAVLFGPALDLAVPESAFISGAASKIISRFPRPVIGSCLLWDSAPDEPPPPALTFRAAALANMIYRPPEGAANGGCLVTWKIGALYWLPPVRNLFNNQPGY
jgi:hypothetical protein